MNISIIGFGEAGPVFAEHLVSKGLDVSAYDVLQDDPDTRERQLQKTKDLGVTPLPSAVDAIRSADLVISTVTASAAVAAAEQAAPGLHSNCHWMDLNSVSPIAKRKIKDTVVGGGAIFTEAVAMDTVPSKGAKVPLLMCGPDSRGLHGLLTQWGLNAEVVGDAYGQASTTKLLRSVVIKGMESLFAESMEAAGRAGVEQAVIDSLQATYPGLNWSEVAGYQLSRSVIHAERRASEMRNASEVVTELGVSALMSEATAKKQQELSDRGIASNFKGGESIQDFIDAVIGSE